MPIIASDVSVIEAGCQTQRFSMRGLLHVDEARSKAADKAAIDRIRAAATSAAYDSALASPAIVELFRRQVLYFGDVR